MTKLTHLTEAGSAHMVDISAKIPTAREACARATVRLSPIAFAALTNGDAPKGDVIAAARIAGIMATKKTAELIPLCHPIALTNATVEFNIIAPDRIIIECWARTIGTTGVEMEALTGASIAALTIYDMLKAVDKSIEIGPLHLISKSGGKSGAWQR
jgi:cyclic pyranopterin monophosphate synthase